MSDSEPTQSKPAWTRKRKLKLALLILLLVVGGTWVWLRTTYPYGINHCCAAGIGLALRTHAENSDGWFPKGKSSPEASLSQLCDDYDGYLYWIRGKNVKFKVAEAVWQEQGELSPETCGWHYVEGLRDTDDHEIAIAWDKAWGLGHNGQRIRGFGREVILVDGSHRGILNKDWPKFALEQREKLAKVMAYREADDPPVRWSDEESLGPNQFPAAAR